MFDDDGHLYIVDRIKDVVIVSGFNVYPSEVESVLMEHPDVRGAVVVGTPDGITGEAVVAHVSGPGRPRTSSTASPVSGSATTSARRPTTSSMNSRWHPPGS